MQVDTSICAADDIFGTKNGSFRLSLHIQYPLFQILNAEDPFCPYSDGIKDILSRMMVLTTTPVIMFMTTTAEFIFPMIVHSVLSAHIWKGQEKVGTLKEPACLTIECPLPNQ
ncbi:MAG: hypothetical protein E7476_11185 [Ruminococcaceae bacterium]|nr:hypothetical protein [Oscillospiraceae bacterium]